MIKWVCDICGEFRPNSAISVRTIDTSKQHNLPAGTVNQNIKYCNDREKCIEESKTFSPTKENEPLPILTKDEPLPTIKPYYHEEGLKIINPIRYVFISKGISMKSMPLWFKRIIALLMFIFASGAIFAFELNIHIILIL